MLSGEFGHIPVRDVTVSRDRRVRKIVTPEAVAQLADSISRKGLVHPIVISRENELIAGETRLEAHKKLGYDVIAFQYEDSLDPAEHREIELEENIKRTDLPWQDQVDALREYHTLRLEQDPEWTVEKTAEAIGLATKTVYTQLAVAKEIVAGNERVARADRYSTARGIVTRTNERRAADDLALLGAVEDAPAVNASPILVADFREWVESYDGPPFNLLHCDFPYGINADKFAQGSAGEFGGYDDTPELYWSLVSTLLENRDKLLGQSGHLLFWFSMRYYTETLAALQSGFRVDPYPLVWHKSDNKGTLPDPERGPRRVYEVAFFCSHGDRKIISPVSNTFSGPTIRQGDHMSEKSQDMLQHFLKMAVDPQTRMLDPTCGSGSALRAARALGAGSVLGLEVNPEFVANARRAFDAPR